LKKQSLYDFFNVDKSHHITDPKIIYDSTSNRWFAVIVDGGITTVLKNGSAYPSCLPDGCRVALAISQGFDPTKQWSNISVNSSKSDRFPDQPNIAANKFNLLLTTTEFNIHKLNPFLRSDEIESSDREHAQNVTKPFVLDTNVELTGGFPKTYVISKDVLFGDKKIIISEKNKFDTDEPVIPISFINTSKCSSTASPIKENPNYELSPITEIKIIDRCSPTDAGFKNEKNILIPKLFPSPPFKQRFLNDEGKAEEIRLFSAIRTDKSIWVALHSACEASFQSNHSCIDIIKFDNVTIKHQPIGLNYAYNLSGYTKFNLNGTDFYYPSIGVSKDGKLVFIAGFSNSTTHPSLIVSKLISENVTQYNTWLTVLI